LASLFLIIFSYTLVYSIFIISDEFKARKENNFGTLKFSIPL